jgi:anti-sigma regulatory factor (Ser/Thr protein kinase)
MPHPLRTGDRTPGMIVPSSSETTSAVRSTEVATSAVASPAVASIAVSDPEAAAPYGPPVDLASFSPHADPPRIAVYDEPRTPPVVVLVAEVPPSDDNLPALIEALARRTHELSQQLGGRMPITVLRELVENLVHASFAGVVITILDQGNTVRISDRGPGIPDKEAALLPGFTSADAYAKRFIRGVGSGFSVVKQTLASLDGALNIEDNLGRGTVVTARVSPSSETPFASATVPAYNLSQRQLKTLLLTVELAPVGPTRIAQELGVSTSTAYRDLVSLEDVGFVISQATGHRSVTEAGLAYLNAVL